jgi:pimeloyl-ACP methyl ester carboxylesterase
MAEDLRCLLDEIGIERPILVGHSFGADIALCFCLLYPERVPKLVALEPGLATLVHLRHDKDWIGWAAWVAKTSVLVNGSPAYVAYISPGQLLLGITRPSPSQRKHSPASGTAES